MGKKGMSGAWRRAMSNPKNDFGYSEVRRVAGDLARFSNIEVPKAYRNSNRGVRHFKIAEDLMDCRDIDKFFRYEGGVPTHKKPQKMRRDTTLGCPAVISILRAGGTIRHHYDTQKRFVYLNGYCAGVITNRVLEAVLSAVPVDTSPIVDGHGLEYKAKAV